MNRFLPWVAGVIGVAVVVTGGFFAYSSFSSQSAEQNREQVEQPLNPEDERVLCNGSEDVVFEDDALVFAIRTALGLPVQFQTPEYRVPCDALLKLEELKAPDRAITRLGGIEHAVNLKTLDLRGNFLTSYASVFQLANLENLNLTNTRLPEFLSASKVKLRYLDLGENQLVNIDALREYTNVQSLSLHQNKISDIRALLEMPKLQAPAVVSLYNNPLNLSSNKESRQIIEQLLHKGVDLFWDELTIVLGAGNTGLSKEVSVYSPDIVSLTARVETNTNVPGGVPIESVEFFEVNAQGVLSSIAVDTEAPFSYGVGFDHGEEGVHRYAAEVRTKYGATVLTPFSEYVTVRVTKPECKKNADCGDSNQCTTDVCQNNKCIHNPTPGCSVCRADSDCKDARQCTTDRCVSGKCEHFMQTACSEGDEISCTDKVDNNKNGKVDCADADCAGHASCKETICYDGTDNDKDGKIDCRDSDCSIEPTCGEICDDGVNNDADPNVDCNDRRDCADHPSCQGHDDVERCNSDVSISCYKWSDTVRCSLSMSLKGSGNQCYGDVVTCDRSQCWYPGNKSNTFDFQGCGSIKTLLQTLPEGTLLKGNAALGLSATQRCEGLNLCRRIILCD